ncbi:MAG: histidine kinase [Marinilabiliaceae bacterium]|nr:histidine kinase [Marinilabiliaceae bacterium]
MLHPILAKSKALYIYCLSWVVLLGLHILVLKQITTMNYGVIIIDSLVYIGVLMFLGLSFWFPLAFADKSKSQTIHFFHTLLVYLIYIGLWYFISYHLVTWILESNSEYIQFSKNTVILRVIVGGIMFLFLATLYHLLDFYRSLEDKTRQEEALKKLVKEAELKALKAQLNPHFLFNSLNSISALTITDVDKAREMVNKLSDFLRYSLKENDTSLLTLNEELKNMTKYLEIEKVRFGERLECIMDIDHDCYLMKLPPMILQPLYENAVKHGVYESLEPIQIRTFCRNKNGYLEISIINNYDPESTPVRGEGVGLSNIRNRMRMIYRRNELFSVFKENNHFEALLIIPQNN